MKKTLLKPIISLFLLPALGILTSTNNFASAQEVVQEAAKETDQETLRETVNNESTRFTEPEVFELPAQDNSLQNKAPSELIVQPFPPETGSPAAKPSVANPITNTAANTAVENIGKAIESTSNLPSENQGLQNLNTEEDLQAENTEEPENSIEELPPPPQPSRAITIKKNQFLDVEYPGNGWLFMGETEKNAKLISFGRGKLNQEKTSFTFRARNQGTTLLHFYKNDILTGSYIDDFLEVTVESEETTSKEHVKAPSYEQIVPPAPNFDLLKENHLQVADMTTSGTRASEDEKDFENADSGNAGTGSDEPYSSRKSSTGSSSYGTYSEAENVSDYQEEHSERSGKTRIQTETESAQKQTGSAKVNQVKSTSNKQALPETESKTAADEIIAGNSSVAELLEKAQKAYDSKNYETALHLVTDFFEQSDLDLDKALYLQGQILEEKSPVQDIKSAIDAYDVIIKNYRQSPLWKNANERSIYLKRFYINIR